MRRYIHLFVAKVQFLKYSKYVIKKYSSEKRGRFLPIPGLDETLPLPVILYLQKLSLF